MADTVGSARDQLAQRILSWAIPAVVVALLLLALIRVQPDVESAVANVNPTVPLLFAFLAGVVASVNPCGFIMLPTYLAYHLGSSEAGYYDRSVVSRAGRGLVLGLAATLGFMMVAAAVGLVVAAGGQWLVTTFQYFGAALGAIMVGVGLWLLIGRGKLTLLAASRVQVSPRRNLGNIVLFGSAYSISSLSCTLPIFLALIGFSLADASFGASFAKFIAYALGMGAVLVTVTVGASLFRGAIASRMHKAIPAINNASTLFLLGAGAWLLYYWVDVLGRLGACRGSGSSSTSNSSSTSSSKSNHSTTAPDRALTTRMPATSARAATGSSRNVRLVWRRRDMPTNKRPSRASIPRANPSSRVTTS